VVLINLMWGIQECLKWTWNYSSLKEYRRELFGGVTLFLEDNEAGFEYGYAEKPQAESQS